MSQWRDTPSGERQWLGGDGNWYSSEQTASTPLVEGFPRPAPVVYRRPDRTSRQPSEPNTIPAGAWLVIIGGILLVAGLFLPWITIGLGAVNRNGLQLGANDAVSSDGLIVMGFGVLTVVIGIARLTGSSMPRWIQGSSIATGLVAGAILGLDYSSLHSLVQKVQTTYPLTAIGYGYWVCGVGAALAVIGGLAIRTPRDRRSTGHRGIVTLIVLVLLLIVAGLLILSTHRARG